MVICFKPLNLCSESKVNIGLVALEEILVILLTAPKVSKNVFTVSLVILFLRSLVTTCPIGASWAYDCACWGLSSGLSLSNCG